MPLLDSNIIIYASKPEYAFLADTIADPEAAMSAISIPEVLGYPSLTTEDQDFFTRLFLRLNVLPVGSSVLTEAAGLRRM